MQSAILDIWESNQFNIALLSELQMPTLDFTEISTLAQYLSNIGHQLMTDMSKIKI